LLTNLYRGSPPVTFVKSLSVLLPAPRATSPEEVAAVPEWRAVCELPHQAPADMAIQAGRAALAGAELPASDVSWVIHAGSGYQGSPGWPVHRHIQHGLIGGDANALEIRQSCSGGLTSWVVADSLARAENTVICTGADNWSWEDRFATSRSVRWIAFSDAAHAAVLSSQAGFAKILGVGQASCPHRSPWWKTREAFWEHATGADFRATVSRVLNGATGESIRETFNMLVRAVTAALKDANLSPQYVTHFVPHSTHSGEPYRSVAKAVGLPWAESLHQNNLDHGYLGVSTQSAGLLRLAKDGALSPDSIVLLLAVEHDVSATAIAIQIARSPVLSIDGPVETMSTPGMPVGHR
jgi:3-oxoacyl-[acyl-carrier-protein] synthase III